jgi:hypothetical protein
MKYYIEVNYTTIFYNITEQNFMSSIQYKIKGIFNGTNYLNMIYSKCVCLMIAVFDAARTVLNLK